MNNSKKKQVNKEDFSETMRRFLQTNPKEVEELEKEKKGEKEKKPKEKDNSNKE